MGTKTISIMDDVHRLLLINRMDSESFSDIIRRSLSKKKNIAKFAGILKRVSDKKIKSMKKEIKNLREKSTKDLLKDIK